MKSFSNKKSGSKQPRKQRVKIFNLSLHEKGKMMNVHLSSDLRKKYSTRNIRVRKGDKVKIISGQHKSKSGKVEKVDLKNYKVVVNGIDVIKKDGSKSFYKFHPSNLMIIELETSDKKRLKKFNENVLVKSKKQDVVSNKKNIKENIIKEKSKEASKDEKKPDVKKETKIEVKKETEIKQTKNEAKEAKK
jgi:large subunit ribosomal protein L24